MKTSVITDIYVLNNSATSFIRDEESTQKLHEGIRQLCDLGKTLKVPLQTASVEILFNADGIPTEARLISSEEV